MQRRGLEEVLSQRSREAQAQEQRTTKVIAAGHNCKVFNDTSLSPNAAYRHQSAEPPGTTALTPALSRRTGRGSRSPCRGFTRKLGRSLPPSPGTPGEGWGEGTSLRHSVTSIETLVSFFSTSPRNTEKLRRKKLYRDVRRKLNPAIRKMPQLPCIGQRWEATRAPFRRR